MELTEVLLKRRSVRKFTEDEIGESVITEIMHAAMSGPSAMNRRPWDFYVVKSDEAISKLKTCTRYSKYNGKIAVIVAGDLERALPEPVSEYWVQDCSAATENILLKAVDLGLGAVWCGVYPQKEETELVKKVLGLNKNIIPLNIIWLGYPDEAPESRDQYEECRVHIL